MSNVIDVNHLSFSFGSGALTQLVLKDITIAIQKGEIVLITGPSGSGKTTFLAIIGGLRQAVQGSVKVLDQEFINSKEATRVKVRKQIGYIFQQHNLLKSLTALQNVSMTLEMQNTMTEQQRYDRARRCWHQTLGYVDEFNYA